VGSVGWGSPGTGSFGSVAGSQAALISATPTSEAETIHRVIFMGITSK